MNKPVEVPLKIYDSMEKMRGQGIDMKDYQAVLNAVAAAGDRETEIWLHDNRKIYMQGVVSGLVPEGMTSEGCLIESLTSPKRTRR